MPGSSSPPTQMKAFIMIARGFLCIQLHHATVKKAAWILHAALYYHKARGLMKATSSTTKPLRAKITAVKTVGCGIERTDIPFLLHYSPLTCSLHSKDNCSFLP